MLLEFPDGTSDDVIGEVIRREFPRNGADVKEDLQDRSFRPDTEDFKLYEDYLKSDDTDTPWTQLMYDAAGHMLSTAGNAIAGAVTDPLAIPTSVVEGAFQGTASLWGVLAQSENPDSWAFKLKDSIMNTGTLEERRQTFLEARDFNTRMEQAYKGETLAVPKELVNNRIVQGAGLILDPTVALPGIGQALGVGKMASKAAAKATIAAGIAARGVAAPVNVALKAAGEGIAKATGLTAHEMQIAAGAVGAGALANPVGQAVVGTVAAARGLDVAGDALTRVGRVMRDQPTRIAPFESVALDAAAPKSVRMFANAAHRLGGDVALDIAPGAVAGMAEGAAVGGALGYFNNGEEGAASGIGGGLAIGGVAAGGVRAVQHLTGHVAVERGRAGGKALIDSLPESEVIGMDTAPKPEFSLEFKDGLPVGDLVSGLELLGNGSESSVYRRGDKVVKVSEPYNNNTEAAYQARVDRAMLIDSLIGDGSLEVEGFYRSKNGTKNPIFTQDYIGGRPATRGEIRAHMESRGFSVKDSSSTTDTFVKTDGTESVTVGDLDGANVIMTPSGKAHIIDADVVGSLSTSAPKKNTSTATIARTTNSKSLGEKLVSRFDAAINGGAGLIADFFARAKQEGINVILADNNTKLPSNFNVGSPDQFKGVAFTTKVDGKAHIVINVDIATKDTVGHELFHTLMGEMSKGEMKRIGSTKLFGIPGISQGLTSPRDIHSWAEGYKSRMDALGSGGWERAIETVFNVDKATGEVSIRTDVTADRLAEAQWAIADEMLAEYGGYDILGKTITGRDKYRGQLRRDKVNTVFESIAALARDTWMRTTEGQVARDGIFNTETKSLLDSKGKLNRNRELSKFMREVVTRDNSLSEDAVRTRIEFKDTKNLDAINEQLGAGSLFELDNNGKVSRVITPNEDKARGITRHAEVKAELDKIAEHERGVRRSLDENGDEVFSFENATDAELAAVLKFLNPIQQDNVRKIIEGIASRDGQPIHIVTNFAALAKGRNGRNQYRGLAPSERKAILYGLELSKEGNFYTRVLDYDQVSRNIAKALRVPEYSKLWANPSDIIVDLKKYLEHLTKSDKPDSAAMFGLNGETKRSFFYEVLGVQPAPTKGAYPERPYRAGFTHSTKDSPFRSMRIDRISRIEATGERAFFNEAQTHHNAQRNYQPADESGFLPDKSLTDPSRFKAEKLGDTEVHTHESGARVLVKGNVNRVYAADGALLGVTNNDAKAEKLLAKHLEKTTPRYSLLSDADMPAMVDSLPEIDLSELVDKKIAPILADRTMVGTYRGIDSSRVEPVRMTGGVRFPEIKANHEKRVVWASNKDIRNTEVADYHLVGFMEENSHRSNASTIGAMVNTIEAYARDGRISKNGVRLADVEVRRITGDKSAPSIASKEFEAYADKHNMSFDMRKNIADTLTKAKFEKLGFPSMERVLRHTIEPSHSGYNWGDMFLVVKVDKGSPRVPLGVNGVPSHESYKHGQSGTLVAKLSKTASHKILFSEFFDKRRAAGAGEAQDVRSFYLAEPVTTVTAEKVAASGSKTKYTAIRNPKHAAMAVDAALGEWRTSDTAVKDGGVGVVDFVRAIQQSDHAASLSNFTPKQVKKMVSRGELKIYQLGDAQVFFALKNMNGGGKELVSVVSNELAGKGVAAPAVMIKAIEEGATNLDCFALKSSKHPAGFLPELYSLFGFAKVGDEITFSEAHYLAGDYAKRSQHELRDLKRSWESTGWKPEHGDPTVVSMQLELSNDNRRNYRRDYIQPAPQALADTAAESGYRSGASAQPHSGNSREGGSGSTDARPHSGTEGNLRGRDLDRPNPRVAFNRVIDEVLSLDAGDIRNLKLDQKKVEALRKFRDSTARYSPSDESYLKAVKSGDMETAQRMVDEAAKKAGYNTKAHHGTSRGDRVGNRFLKSRATSGAMPFFTDARPIAENYSKGKRDTSLQMPEDYRDWFKLKFGKREENLRSAWYSLTPEQRKLATERLPTTGYTDSYQGEGAIVHTSKSIMGEDSVAWELKQAKGNVLEAAKAIWLDGGNLFGREAEFLDVLKALGIDNARLDDPNATNPKVYDVHLKLNNPLVTTDIPKSVMSELKSVANRQRKPAAEYGADMWDKSTRHASEWIKQLEDDYAQGKNSMVWTSIPDWVTKTLKSLGYDSIHDAGGKMGGKEHNVYIPFEPEQIKSSEPTTLDAKGKVIPLSQRFDDTKSDIRYSPVVSDAVKSAERQKSAAHNEAIRDRVRSRRITSPSAAAAMVGEYPSYLDIPTSYLAEMSEKLKAGKITTREVAKAYAMTITSQGVDSIAVDVIKKEFPQFNPSEMFTGIGGNGKPNIRPEEATAYWFSTPEGKRALDNVESGNFNPEDWRVMQRIRELGGDDRVRNLGMLLREGQQDTWQLTEKAKSKATIYNEDGTPKLALDEDGLVKTKTVMHNDGDFTMAFINEATQLVNETRGDAEQLKEVLERFKGIKAAKSPFMGHLLGFGGDITLDAVEMNYWLSGGGDIKQLGRGVNKSDAKLAAETELKKLVEFVKHDKVAQFELKTRIRSAMRKMRDMTPSAQGIPDSAFYHIMHHWVWDAAKNATTTHEGMYEAMRRYQPFSDARTETVGDVTVTTDRSGMKMTQRGSGAARLYAADGRLMGVYTGVSEAIRKASRIAGAKELRGD